MKPSKRLLIGFIGILVWLLFTMVVLSNGEREILLEIIEILAFFGWFAALVFILVWTIMGFEE